MSVEHTPHSSARTIRIATRTRILFFLIPALAVAITLFAGRSISIGIADDSSRRLSRQYSIEAAANFQIGVNEHFVLMQQISRSTTISRWLANENDMAIRELAFEETMGYAAFAPNVYLMFTVYETLSGYNFDVGMTFEEFERWGHLVYGSFASQWFFDTRDAGAPFILNIQRTRPVDDHWELYIWSNHRMYYKGQFVGVITAGSNFDDIFDLVFGDFDVGLRRGYIIDQHGYVRADSAGLLATADEGLPVFPSLPEALYNPILADRIDEHLQSLADGVFSTDTQRFDSIRLMEGLYRYASISPITGTKWSVVVLSNDMGDFAFGGQYTALIFGSALILILSVVSGIIIMHRLAFVPLSKLTESAMAISVTDTEANFFGLERNDEIGYLARTFRDYMQKVRDAIGKENQAMSRQLQISNASPIPSSTWSLDFKPLGCNEAMVRLLGMSDKSDFISRFYNFTPEMQSGGIATAEKIAWVIKETSEKGDCHYDWLFLHADGELIPGECVAKLIVLEDTQFLSVHFQDLRHTFAMIEEERKAHTALEYRTMLLNTINKAAETLLASDDAHSIDALMKGMELVGRSLNACRVQIWRYEEVDGKLSFVLQHSWLSEVGKQKRIVPIGFNYPHGENPDWVRSILVGESINGPISKMPPSVAASFRDIDVVSVLMTPLTLESKTIGVLSIHDCVHERTFSKNELDMVISAGFMFCSVYSKNMQRELAYTDMLTGAHNRRYFMLTADQDLQRCLEKNMDFSLIMIDLDRFKSINDRYGHVVGDEVLKILSARVSRVLKEGTLFARYGGEEFVIVLPGVGFENAINTAWRVQKNIAQSPFRTKSFEIAATASFGVTSKTDKYTELLEIIHNADIALYKAKNSGRNTVVGFIEDTN